MFQPSERSNGPYNAGDRISHTPACAPLLQSRTDEETVTGTDDYTSMFGVSETRETSRLLLTDLVRRRRHRRANAGPKRIEN